MKIGCHCDHGFRGEALPSIGSVATLSLTSRPEGGEGWRLVVDNGRIVHDGPASAAPGTVARVDGLFAQVPARRKFLKSPRSELALALIISDGWPWRGPKWVSWSNTKAGAF